MINFILKIILNRNFILVFAVIMGMTFGNYASYIKGNTFNFIKILIIQTSI